MNTLSVSELATFMADIVKPRENMKSEIEIVMHLSDEQLRTLDASLTDEQCVEILELVDSKWHDILSPAIESMIATIIDEVKNEATL